MIWCKVTTTFPEDDVRLLNPNRLEGHEGRLLKVIEPGALTGFAQCHDLEAWEGWDEPGTATGWTDPKQIPHSSIVMFIACDYKDDDPDQWGWVDLLFEEKKLRVFIRLSQWMRYFAPWPSWAAFIHE